MRQEARSAERPREQRGTWLDERSRAGVVCHPDVPARGRSSRAKGRADPRDEPL